MTGEEQKEARLAWFTAPCHVSERLQSQLMAHGGEFFAGNRLTVA